MVEFSLTDLVPPGLLKQLEEEQCSLIYTTENGWIKYPNTSVLLLGSNGDTINNKLDQIIKKLEGDSDGIGEISQPTDGIDL